MLAGPLSYYQQQQTSLTGLFADKYLQGECHHCRAAAALHLKNTVILLSWYAWLWDVGPRVLSGKGKKSQPFKLLFCSCFSPVPLQDASQLDASPKGRS